MAVFDFVLVVFIYSFFICVLSVFMAFSFIVFHKACLEERDKAKSFKQDEGSKPGLIKDSYEVKGASPKEDKSRQALWNFLNYDGGDMPDFKDDFDSAKSGNGFNQ